MLPPRAASAETAANLLKPNPALNLAPFGRWTLSVGRSAGGERSKGPEILAAQPLTDFFYRLVRRQEIRRDHRH
jgi:hypothetical protein